MKHFNTLLVLLLVCSCTGNKPKQTPVVAEPIIPTTFIAGSSKNIWVKNDTVFMNDKKYSGFICQLYPGTKDTAFIEGYYSGLLSGVCKKWYPNKQLTEERKYTEGKKNGRQLSYWENGKKRFEFIAKNDAYEGELKEWAFDGKLIHLANFVNGQEEGPQQMWYDNGKIRANYVIIKGKRYGLLGTKNCKNVSDSIFAVK